MSKKIQSMVWASAIIIAALFMNLNGMSDGASLGVIAGLSGAAWGSLQSDLGCGHRCLL